MQIYSSSKVSELRKFRRKGLSISELMKKFSMPKTSIWHHIHDIELSSKYIALIKSRQGGSKIRSQKEWTRADEHAKEILKSKKRFPCSLAAMLYWAEGNKKGFIFTNTDGEMIKLYLNLLKNYLDIKEERIKLTLRTFSNLNQSECINYWSKITRLPKENFKIYLNDGGKRGKAKYGMCRLTVEKSGYLYKLIMALINNIKTEMAK